jgi:hypothetical protein
MKMTAKSPSTIRLNILLVTADQWRGDLLGSAGDPAKASLRQEGLDRMMNWRQRHEERTLTGFLARLGRFTRTKARADRL